MAGVALASALAVLAPALFTERMRKVYAVLFSNPVTV